jgi:hypothetical protein
MSEAICGSAPRMSPSSGARIRATRWLMRATPWWTNIALRPPAFVKEKPTVSRATAETEIGKWAEGTPRFRKLRMKIVAQFPRAQKSLADYYKDRFKKPDENAEEMVQPPLDSVFRSYFNASIGVNRMRGTRGAFRFRHHAASGMPAIGTQFSCDPMLKLTGGVNRGMEDIETRQATERTPLRKPQCA